MSDGSFGFDLILILIIVACVTISTFWRKFSIGRLLHRDETFVDSPDSSAIISYYSAGHMVAGATRSKLGGMKYSTYLTLPAIDATYTDDSAAIFALDLPFTTATHIVGLSKQHSIDRVQFGNFLRANGMSKVELEGDFPDYFDIYAAEGQDVAIREVLNPKSMAFVVDYCRSHFWEINSAELYIVASEADKGGGSIISESQQFVEQIKPALLPGHGAAPVHHIVPYGEYDGGPLPCPICQQIMPVTDNWLTCPAGHGVLINGRDIVRLREHKLTIPNDASKTVKHGLLTCPYCHNQMSLVNYQDSGVEIDSCEHCPYRWLDAAEITTLGSKV